MKNKLGQIEKIIILDNDDKNCCPHCRFLHDTFIGLKNGTTREYWIMTEVFVYLHKGDVCNYKKVNEWQQ